MKFPMHQVDAFTRTPLAGNPCAVILDADPLSEERMQQIAGEMNLAETAFVLTSTRADVRARYFTPSEEIPFAGHPTVATLFTLIRAGRLRLEGGEAAGSCTFTLELSGGLVPIHVAWERGAGDDVELAITFTAAAPRFLRVYTAEEVLPCFGLEPADALPSVSIRTVDTGTPQIMVPVRSLAALRRAELDIARYRRLKETGDFFSPHLFALGGFTPAGDTAARHFGVPPDLIEDPFTGSATSGMGAYLWHHALLDAPRFVAEQGHDMGRPGRADVEVLGPREAIEGVSVTGTAVEVLRGELDLA